MDASAQLHPLFRQVIPVALYLLQDILHLLLFPLTYQVSPVRRDAASREKKPFIWVFVNHSVQLNWRSFDGFLAVLISFSTWASSFSEDKLSRQILVDFLGKASASGMCLTDSPSHFQGLSVGCLRGWRQRNWRCFLSYIYWSKFCSIISPYPVANTFTR